MSQLEQGSLLSGWMAGQHGNDATVAKRRLLVPDVRAENAAESASAILRALSQGFHLSTADHLIEEQLRQQSSSTTVPDVPTVANLEDLTQKIGLGVAQVQLPVDHLLLRADECLPAIVLLKHAEHTPHLALIWRRHGPFFELLDPLAGRQWITTNQLGRKLAAETILISTMAWRSWADTPDFIQPLQQRLQRLGLEKHIVKEYIANAQQDASWLALARLDAATRMVTAYYRTQVITKGNAAQTLLDHLLNNERTGDSKSESIPDRYWSVVVQPTKEGDPEVATMLLQRTLTVLSIRGLQTTAEVSNPELFTTDTEANELATEATLDSSKGTEQDEAEQEKVVPASTTPSIQNRLLQMLTADGLFVPSAIAFAIITAALSVTFEALLLKGIMQIGSVLTQPNQRMGALIAIVIFFVLLLILSVLIFSTSLHLGRRIETRLRVAFLRKIPRLDSQYFASRPIADLVQRAFSLAEIRDLPGRVGELLQHLFLLLFTAAGIIWLDPGSTVTVLLAIVGYFGILYIFFPKIIACSYQVRVEDNYVERYPLDALRGLIPIRTHSAERVMRRAFDEKLIPWSNAQLSMFQMLAFLQSLVAFVYAGVVAWLLYSYVARGGAMEGILLLAYWAINLPKILNDLTQAVSGYASIQGLGKMLYEPLDAPEEFASQGEIVPPPNLPPDGGEADAAVFNVPTKSDVAVPSPSSLTNSVSAGLGSSTVSQLFTTPVSINFDHVQLELLGKQVLRNLSLTICAGEQIGIVGSSGAGKSTLLGLLLGWYQPVGGQVLVDGWPLDGQTIRLLRQQIAWVDPSIQLQNRTLLENLLYGTSPTETPPVARLIEQSDLSGVLERLPDGLRTQVGEEGGMLSGGEGQRVRLGRAMLRRDAPLVLLDEPFRGLDRDKRRELLRRARAYWPEATLLCVTHDVGETQSFARVLVVEDGQIVEDDAPDTLLARADSRYSTLLRAEEAVRRGLWEAADWRRLWLANGQLQEHSI